MPDQEPTSPQSPNSPNDTHGLVPVEQPQFPQRVSKPRVWTVFVVFLLVIIGIFVLQVGAIVPLVIWHLQRGVKPEQLQTELVASFTHPAAFIGMAALGQLALGGSAVAAGWFSPVPLARRLGFVRSTWSVRETAIVLLGTLVPFAIGISSVYALARVITPDPSVKKLYDNMTFGWFILFIPFIALAPAFNEEMFFRGYVQRRLLDRFNPWIALAITSVVFGLFHVMPHAIAGAFPLGVWLGLMAWRSGSIWPGIVCHALVNGLWNIRAMAVKFELIPQRPPLAFLILLALVGVPAFLWSLRLMFHRGAG